MQFEGNSNYNLHTYWCIFLPNVTLKRENIFICQHNPKKHKYLAVQKEKLILEIPMCLF